MPRAAGVLSQVPLHFHEKHLCAVSCMSSLSRTFEHSVHVEKCVGLSIPPKHLLVSMLTHGRAGAPLVGRNLNSTKMKVRLVKTVRLVEAPGAS